MNKTEELYMFDVCDRYIWSHWKEIFAIDDVKECDEAE